MADEEQLAILKNGVEAWNAWRKAHVNEHVDLSGANLEGAKLMMADLSGVNLSRANLKSAQLSEVDFTKAELANAELQWAHLYGADLRLVNLREARFMGADLSRTDLRQAELQGAWINDARAPYADFRKAHLSDAVLKGSDFREADFRHANLTNANLQNTQLTRAKFQSATLVGCKVFGAAAWELELDEHTVQLSLDISGPDTSSIHVDNLEVAQFIYLLLNNQRIRNVIDTITSKVVLILGRFTEERKAVLDALRDELRQRDYLPILFDFDEPANRDLTETIQTLAGMARFVIADLTDAKSLPQELSEIVPRLPSVPVKPILLAGTSEYAMFEHWRRYPWVLPVYEYKRTESLLAALPSRVIAPAERKAEKLQKTTRRPELPG